MKTPAGHPTLGRGAKGRRVDVEQGLRHSAYAASTPSISVFLAPGLCGHAARHFLLQHEMHVADRGARAEDAGTATAWKWCRGGCRRAERRSCAAPGDEVRIEDILTCTRGALASWNQASARASRRRFDEVHVHARAQQYPGQRAYYPVRFDERVHRQPDHASTMRGWRRGHAEMLPSVRTWSRGSPRSMLRIHAWRDRRTDFHQARRADEVG